MNKVAFITGAGGYIGSETARTLAKSGIAIAVCDINEEAVNKTLESINFSSAVGINGLKTCTDYAAAKGGVMSLTKALAKELGPYKTNVNSIAPGVVMRPEENGGGDRALKTNLLGKQCMAEDIANLVEFLVSDKAGFITGQTYVCDGGRTLSMKGTD